MNKKSLLQLMAVMMVAMLSIGFASCGGDDDDDNGGGNTAGLVGKWRCVYKKSESYYMSNGEWYPKKNEEKNYEDDTESSGFIFNADGTAQLIYAKADGSYTLETNNVFKYKTENGHLYLLEDSPEDTDGWEDWGVLTLTGNTLELVENEVTSTKKKNSIKRYQKL